MFVQPEVPVIINGAIAFHLPYYLYGQLLFSFSSILIPTEDAVLLGMAALQEKLSFQTASRVPQAITVMVVMVD